MQVHLQHIAGHHLHIGAVCQGLGQHIRQAAIKLHGGYLTAHGGQLFGEHADARPDLQHAGTVVRFQCCCHTGAHGGVDQKVLPQRFGKSEAVTG